ncbi:MAG: hypothetical protein VX787_08790 [Pseudomonadota bacterium]|nr:hypothetical protein [Pseudomonadota bacterium]
MTESNLEARVARLENAVQSLHNSNLTLMNRELVQRALLYTLLEHIPAEQRKAMSETYDKYMVGILEQVPPQFQKREILQEIEEMLLQESPGAG